MKHLKFGYPLVGAVAAVAMLAGCADENPWGNSSEEQGSISISLKTDSSISTAKPVFRSGEDDETRASTDLKDYITLPEVDDFEITLTNSKGTPVKQCTYGEFKEAIKTEKFAADIYTLTASIQGYDSAEVVEGNQEHSTNGFNCYYFEGSTTFTVIPNRTTEIDLTAELKKSMVRINFDQSFIDYVEEGFSAYVHNSDDNKLIPFVKDETKIAFIDPSTAELTAHFTTKVTGKEQTATVKVGDFQAVAKTLHNITLAINNENGFATLTVNFDETLDGNDDVNVNLTDELYETPAPEIECIGFENNSYNDISGGIAEGTTYSMRVNALGGLKTATLTLEGKTIGGKETFDLFQASDVTTLTNGGITVRNFAAGEKIATVDFTNLVKQLNNDEKCTIMLEVSDQKDKTYIYKDSQGNEIQGAKATFDKKAVLLRRLKADGTNPSDEKIPYGSDQAVVYLEYNGNPNDLTFTASDGQPITLKSEVIETRGLENKLYKFTLDRTFKCNKVTVTANYKGKEVGKQEIVVDVPEYSITESDAYNNYAYLKVVASKPTELQTILDNLEIRGNGKKFDDANVSKDYTTGVITLRALTSGTPYEVTSSITSDKTGCNVNFKTESETPIPNGTFSSVNANGISFDNVQVGGQYRVSPTDYTIHSSIKRDTPMEWATVNDLTAWDGSSNKNTWFIVPSTYVENETAIIRSVGYHHAGTTPARSGGAFNIKYYCENAPSTLDKAAGELFLGSYTVNAKGQGTKTEGITFKSRPQSISFKYTYTSYEGDVGYALIDLRDSENNSLGNKTFQLENGSGTVTLPLQYVMFGNEAVKLKISFKSSNSSTPPINIPTGDSLNEHAGLGNKTLDPNSYKAFASGSELRISNVVATYWENTNSVPTPKPKTIKRK